MKFLLEFVSCCGAQSRSSSSREGEEVPGPAGAPRSSSTSSSSSSEETRALVAPRAYGRRKRGRVGPTGSASFWRPTLRSISEDTVAVAVGVEGGAERVVKKKGRGRRGGCGGGGGGASRNIARIPSSYVDDYRGNRFATMIPAFSPTPFML